MIPLLDAQGRRGEELGFEDVHGSDKLGRLEELCAIQQLVGPSTGGHTSRGR